MIDKDFLTLWYSSPLTSQLAKISISLFLFHHLFPLVGLYIYYFFCGVRSQTLNKMFVLLVLIKKDQNPWNEYVTQTLNFVTSEKPISKTISQQ